MEWRCIEEDEDKLNHEGEERQKKTSSGKVTVEEWPLGEAVEGEEMKLFRGRKTYKALRNKLLNKVTELAEICKFWFHCLLWEI